MREGVSGNRVTIELTARSALSSRVDRLRFASATSFHWAAGQYLVVLRGNGQDLFLPYSLASAYDPANPGQFELAVAVNAGAEVMDALMPGDTLEVEGPSGDFTWQPAPSPAALLIGVGTGIAPLRALVSEELARPTSNVRLLLIAGHRAPEDVLFEADFAQLAQAHARFHFIPTLTLGGDDWPGKRGRVQAQLVEAVSSLGRFDAYVCGRLDMVNDVVESLIRHGVPESRVRHEGY